MSDAPISDQELMAHAVEERSRREGTRKYKSVRERGNPEEYSPSLRPLSPRERALVMELFGPAKMDPAKADAALGLRPGVSARIMNRPHVRLALNRTLAGAARKAGVELDKQRLVEELDHALNRAREAFDKKVRVGVECKRCGSTDITCKNCGAKLAKVVVKVGPREVAQLATATSRAVETTAKIIGAIAPTHFEHQHKHQVTGSYTEILRMVHDYPTMFTPQELAHIRDAAVADQAEIAELLRTLEPPPAVAH